MSREIIWTKQFKRDYKLAIKRGLNIKLIDDCICRLAEGLPLPQKCHDHGLTGKWEGHRECHILPDWLMIYRIDDDGSLLTLACAGTHSDLFT
jgi:mRNA interferase YafQ